jgi:hypothetical protein
MAYATTLTTRARSSVVGLTILALAGFWWATQGADAGPQPADKVAVAASGVQLTPVTQVGPGTSVVPELTMFATTMRVSSPSDLILSVTSECALWTNTATIGDDDQESKARVEVWIEIDGRVVPVSETNDPARPPSIDPDDAADRGRVVFCNRAQRMKTEGFDDTDEPEGEKESDEDVNDVIRLFNRTRSAHGFNWVAVNVGGPNYDKDGDNVVDIVVKARLAAQVICDNDPTSTDPDCAPAFAGPPQNPAARAGVGKRSLVIEPTKLVKTATT